jgi:hypothetical protein
MSSGQPTNNPIGNDFADPLGVNAVRAAAVNGVSPAAARVVQAATVPSGYLILPA